MKMQTIKKVPPAQLRWRRKARGKKTSKKENKIERKIYEQYHNGQYQFQFTRNEIKIMEKNNGINVPFSYP